jgi:isoleucyl-tRNA synthetase
VLFESLKLFAPVAPFIVEKMYLNLREEFGLKEKSIHMHAWPKTVESYVDVKLEKQFECAQQVIQGVLSGRDKIQTGIRWPLAEAVIVTADKDTIASIGTMKELIQMQTNVREISVKSMLPGITTTLMPDHKQLGPDFGKLVPGIVAQLSTSLPETIMQHLEKEGKHVVTVDGEDISIVKEHLIFNRAVPEPYTEVSFRQGHVYMNSEVSEELEREGYVRELMRRVQSARKSAGLEKTDSIDLFIQVDDLELDSYEDQIASKVGASSVELTASKPSRSFKHSSKETIRGKEFLIAFSVA